MFTTEEYITENALGVEFGDTKGYKMVADHLRSLGYMQWRRNREGKVKMVWIRVDRNTQLTLLAERLRQLKEKEDGQT